MSLYEKSGNGYKIYVQRPDFTEEYDTEMYWIKVEKKGGGNWIIVDENVTDKRKNPIRYATEFGYYEYDEEVVNHSGPNTRSRGCSDKLQYKDVFVKVKSIQAKTIEEIAEAFDHIIVHSYCPGDD